MTDAPTPQPPVLHRAALERVLMRAAELHAASADLPDTLTEAELTSLANEVGISTQALRQALVEERMRIVLPNETGILASLYGPATFAATRQLVGEAKAILARLDGDLQAEENLKESRRFPDRIVWGARGGFAGAIRTITRLDGRGFPLARADEVSAVVVPAETGRAHVRIEATLHARRVSAAQTTGVGVFSGLLVGSIVAVLAPLAAYAVATGVAVGAALAAMTALSARRSYQRDARFAQLAIEQALDRVEFGEPRKRSLFSGL